MPMALPDSLSTAAPASPARARMARTTIVRARGWRPSMSVAWTRERRTTVADTGRTPAPPA